MPEILDEASQLESATINVARTAATVKGGRRFSFGALVVVGDRRGKVGFGHAKSKEVPAAIEKAQKYARKAMKPVPLIGTTIPHQVEGIFSASKVRLIPASPGTGVVAGQAVRAILEMAGIADCLTKAYGSTNPYNVVKAVFEGLSQLRPSAKVAELRGVELGKTAIESRIEKGAAFAAPVKRVIRKPEQDQDKGRPRRGGRGGGGGGGRGGGPRGGGGGGGGGRPRQGPADAGATPGGPA